jgi:hypothetical protein
MLGVAGIKFWFFSSTLFTYRLGDSSMNFNVLENPLAALFAVAAIFIGYYALIYFVRGGAAAPGRAPTTPTPPLILWDACVLPSCHSHSTP